MLPALDRGPVPPVIYGQWQTIDSAQRVTYETVALLRMRNGRVYRAAWHYRGRGCAWWPDEGQQRQRAIGLYEPTHWKPLAIGIGQARRGNISRPR
jgi:hypothetical protein